jgi:hypothetical protein
MFEEDDLILCNSKLDSILDGIRVIGLAITGRTLVTSADEISLV